MSDIEAAAKGAIETGVSFAADFAVPGAGVAVGAVQLAGDVAEHGEQVLKEVSSFVSGAPKSQIR